MEGRKQSPADLPDKILAQVLSKVAQAQAAEPSFSRSLLAAASATY